ncbi:uncharacterized protein Gasu_13560 [Galdieria sulphuraria]|uniref:DOT1 domain-containing protein n=1 Tax=Galdieria sulphuraria TaxID=130081 RepID=M2XMJ6_GALSU|nr:uncharacterized protein Gasu_13560 [Galdieria sulphuraria]EME31392.1 hypothetical protein Gasu_13560 [Galdieria sulphuraria]|eukprot:XP_005707912.1 hypothetical protein Gasu_13560 [Galdieria sulphuraria]
MLSQAVGIVLGVHACFLPFLWCFKSAPFCPSTSTTVSTFIKICNDFVASQRISPDRVKVVDLGSGSGTVLFAAAKQGFCSVGYERNPWLVAWTRAKIKTQGLSSLVRIYRQSLFSADLSDVNIVYFFAVPSMLSDLVSIFIILSCFIDIL